MLSDDQIRAVFMAHGFTIKEGQTDLKPYVYAAARALLAVADGAEPYAWEAPSGCGVVRFVTEARYRKFSPIIQRYYRPINAAPTMGEPVVGPSASDWECVGSFLEDDGRWGKVAPEYANDPEAVKLYRKRGAK